jgi:pimeloyl-ACP methyl ester carboxylesterase
MHSDTWTIDGADGQVIIGQACGVLLIAHGFKGYKDYGFMPRLAADAAAAGLIAHRFNFSHSGMTDNIDTFERADLFERDTWSKQVFDLLAVHQAVRDGRLAGKGLPIVWFGHSRGGTTCILAAAQVGEGLAGIAPTSAPDSCCNFDERTIAIMKQDGFVVSPSGRTGQQLRVGRMWLDEIEADPDGHDPIKAIAKVRCPIQLVHGDEDPTVPVTAAHRLGAAAGGRAQALIVAGAQHTFNCANPLEGEPPMQTRVMIDAVCGFARGCCGG